MEPCGEGGIAKFQSYNHANYSIWLLLNYRAAFAAVGSRPPKFEDELIGFSLNRRIEHACGVGSLGVFEYRTGRFELETRSLKNSLDWHCPTPLQRGVARFMADGHLKRHVQKLRRIYQARRQLLLELLRRDLSEWLQPIPSYYGMHIAAIAVRPLDLDRVSARLLLSNVKVHSLSRYYLGKPTRCGLIFGYGAVELPDIKRGLSAVRAAFAAGP